jgi:thiamine kinase-like enzyme
MDEREVERLVRLVPAWRNADLSVHPIHGGITNRNFRVSTADGDYVVRIPGERTELLGIDRRNEAEAARRAADAGIGPRVFGELPGVGTLIVEFLPGEHLGVDEFTDRLDEVVDAMRVLHASGPLRGVFPIHRVVEWHARDATAHGVMPPSAYERLHQQSRRIERVFQADPMPPVPCHNDLLPGNVLFSDAQPGDAAGARVWLLDFEYAGMNDVFFDLGNLSVNAGLSAGAEEDLLRLYFGTITHGHLARLALMKVMSEFREGMWAVVQQAISTLDTDFVAYADERFDNCERLVASPRFEQWLDDAARVADPD